MPHHGLGHIQGLRETCRHLNLRVLEEGSKLFQQVQDEVLGLLQVDQEVIRDR